MDEQTEELTPLDPAYKTLLRVEASILALLIMVAVSVASLAVSDIILWAGVPALLVIGYLVIRLPYRRWASRGYSLAEERLRFVKGVLFHADTVVPFGRVQHIDVQQGPLERAFDLATLTVHTAGNHNASVQVPGLKHADAVAMRETIRAAIRRDTR